MKRVLSIVLAMALVVCSVYGAVASGQMSNREYAEAFAPALIDYCTALIKYGGDNSSDNMAEALTLVLELHGIVYDGTFVQTMLCISYFDDLEPSAIIWNPSETALRLAAMHMSGAVTMEQTITTMTGAMDEMMPIVLD